MKKTLVTAIVLYFFYSLSAQVDSTLLRSYKIDHKFRIYKTWISLNNKTEIRKAVLYDVTDSSLLLSSSVLKKDYPNGNYEVSKIEFYDIDYVKTRAKNSVGKGALIGSISGFALGGILGLLSGDDDTEDEYFALSAEQKALGGAFGFAIGGAGIGALCGLIQLKIPIHGNRLNFNSNKGALKKRTIR